MSAQPERKPTPLENAVIHDDIPEEIWNIIMGAMENNDDTVPAVPEHGIEFDPVIKHHALQRTVTGTVELDGLVYGFEIEDGISAGTRLQQWTRIEKFVEPEPHKPTIFTMVPRNSELMHNRPQMFEVYLAWRKMHWFEELVRHYNYDRYVTAGQSRDIREYYAQKAACRGMVWEDSEIADEMISTYQSLKRLGAFMENKNG